MILNSRAWIESLCLSDTELEFLLPAIQIWMDILTSDILPVCCLNSNSKSSQSQLNQKFSDKKFRQPTCIKSARLSASALSCVAFCRATSAFSSYTSFCFSICSSSFFTPSLGHFCEGQKTVQWVKPAVPGLRTGAGGMTRLALWEQTVQQQLLLLPAGRLAAGPPEP